ncbi:DUF72 domain-containing protein [soil metagenome]|jgi:uncharacterized protein YecE (DUF72 family)
MTDVYKSNNIYTGTSGMVLPLPNRQSFPPELQEKSRLEIYATYFSSLEINSSFYKLPMAKTVAKWAANVPAGFKFTFKLWRDITHNKELAFNPDDVSRFMQVIAHAGDKKGCLLIQLPPSRDVSYARQLEVLLNTIKQADAEHGWKIAIEFRNRSWYNEDIYAMLDENRAGVVMHDMPASTPGMLEQDVDFVYLRFHGPNGGYRGSYPDDHLYEYAQYIKEWQADGKEVYVYFNNTMGDAVKNLMLLNEYLRE